MTNELLVAGQPREKKEKTNGLVGVKTGGGAIFVNSQLSYTCIICLEFSKVTFSLTIWNALTHDFQQCGILTHVDSDEPVQPLFKLHCIPNDVRAVA